MSESQPDLSDLPPSAELVYTVVDEHGPLTRQELLDRIDRHYRTVGDAVRALENRDYLSREPNIGDLREVVYSIRDGP